MSKKIHKLKQTESYDFGLVAISSPENDYRISWVLNNSFGYNLIRQEDLKVFHERLEDLQEFSQFLYFDEETLLLYRLISNKCENGYLLEEINKIDYVLQISGEMDESFLDGLVKDLNSMEDITLAIKIDPANLKSKKKLLL
ncbi:IPExxxVDY family protein [Bacteroidota bacterium]